MRSVKGKLVGFVAVWLLACTGASFAEDASPSDEQVLMKVLEVFVGCGAMSSTMESLPAREGISAAQWAEHLHDRRELAIAANLGEHLFNVADKAFNEMASRPLPGTTELEPIEQTLKRVDAELALCDEFMAKLPGKDGS